MEPVDEHRPYLLAVAYRMLGSRADAEDVVQEAFLRWREAPRDDVQAPRAYLAQVVTRLCLDQLKSARARREEYVGPWLPEPLPTGNDDDSLPPDKISLAESVSLAFLLVLESLSPAERAVFLLREVFDHDFAEIASALGKSEAACRQIFHRAKEHVAAKRPRFRADPGARERLTMGFLQACAMGDVSAMMGLLREDAVFVSDGGGKAKAATRPVYGRDHVAKMLIGLAKKGGGGAGDVEVELRELNGSPGLVLRHQGQITSAMVLIIDGDQIAQVLTVRNPDKLAGLG